MGWYRVDFVGVSCGGRYSIGFVLVRFWIGLGGGRISVYSFLGLVFLGRRR